MQHACRTLPQMPVVAGPGLPVPWIGPFPGAAFVMQDCVNWIWRMYHGGAMQGSPLPPCPDHPQILTGARKMLENDHDISDHPGSFVYLTPVRNCQMGSEMIFHPWSLRHSSFGISLWWLHIAMIVSRRLELVSILPPPMCTNDWPVIAWQLHLSITGVLGVAWSGLNWRYLHSLSEPCCKSKPETGNVVNCNSYFQFRHCMSPIKLCLLRKQFQFRSPWLAFLHPFYKYLSFEKETLSELGTVIPSEHQYNLSE